MDIARNHKGDRPISYDIKENKEYLEILNFSASSIESFDIDKLINAVQKLRNTILMTKKFKFGNGGKGSIFPIKSLTERKS